MHYRSQQQWHGIPAISIEVPGRAVGAIAIGNVAVGAVAVGLVEIGRAHV